MAKDSLPQFNHEATQKECAVKSYRRRVAHVALILGLLFLGYSYYYLPSQVRA